MVAFEIAALGEIERNQVGLEIIDGAAVVTAHARWAPGS